jgi:hypothetical protein
MLPNYKETSIEARRANKEILGVVASLARAAGSNPNSRIVISPTTPHAYFCIARQPNARCKSQKSPDFGRTPYRKTLVLQYERALRRSTITEFCIKKSCCVRKQLVRARDFLSTQRLNARRTGFARSQ